MARPGRHRSGGRRAGGQRIIAGRWRGRRLIPPELPGLRPTPDRVRETLFNWLQPVIAGARCLDLFAGSGMLGFEALSRGAASCHAVDSAPGATQYLGRAGRTLGADALEIIQCDALDYLAGPVTRFDIVFVDPPFGGGLVTPVLERLLVGHWVGPASWVYVEMESPLMTESLPDGLLLHRSGQAGEVCYHLLAGA